MPVPELFPSTPELGYTGTAPESEPASRIFADGQLIPPEVGAAADWKVTGSYTVGKEHFVKILSPDGNVEKSIPLVKAMEAHLSHSPEEVERRVEAAEEAGGKAVEETVETSSEVKSIVDAEESDLGDSEPDTPSEELNEFWPEDNEPTPGPELGAEADDEEASEPAHETETRDEEAGEETPEVEEEPEPPEEIEPITEEPVLSEAELLDKARKLGISDEAIATALRKKYSVEDLVHAVEHTNPYFRDELHRDGIDLPGLNKAEEAEEYREDKWLYDRNKIPMSELQYFRTKIDEDPGWLRANLVRPGSIPASIETYRRPVVGRLLRALNRAYIPLLGERLLIRRMLGAKRERLGPNQDWGRFGGGGRLREEIRNEIHAQDQAVRRARRLLSPGYSYMNRGKRRELAVSDLASELAEIKRNAERFDQGIVEFEPHESDESREFAARFDQLANLGVRTQEQQPRFDKMIGVNERRIKILDKNEFDQLVTSEHRSPAEETRYRELMNQYPEWRPGRMRRK